MAANPIEADSAEVTLPTLFSTFARNTLASAVEVLVAVLDAMDGDPDHEDGTGLEDEGIVLRYDTDGPGCIASDCGEYAGDEKDCAWIEWENLSRSQKGNQNVMGVNDEDAEDSDPCDSNNADDEHLSCPPGRSGPGCPISDPGGCQYD